MRSVIPAITLAFLPTAGVCGEWVAKDGVALSEQDGARMVVACDTEHGRALHPDSLGKILIFVTEPRANWTKFAKVEVKTIADDGPPATSQPSLGTALTPTSLVIEDDATWELSEMGSAKKTFTIRAGPFSRTYSVLRLREAVGPTLEKCGDHW